MKIKSIFTALAMCLLIASNATAGARYVEGEMIVKFKEEAGAAVASEALGAAGVHTLRYFEFTGARLVALPEGQTVDEAVEAFKSNPDVEYAEPNYIISKSAVPNDTYYGADQWGMTQINAPSAWDIRTDASSAIIAIMDTGIDYSHPDLASNVWTNPAETVNGIDDDLNGYVDDVNGYDFINRDGDPADDDIDGHGTHVSGIAAAVGNNNMGVAGVAWRASVMALKILSADGSGSVAGEIEAIDYAISMGAKVISASFSYPSECVPQTPSYAERDAIQRARDNGVLFVAAAGNQLCDNDIYPSFPASHDVSNIISVASNSRQDQPSWFSNYGQVSVDVSAPGESILSTVPGQNYAYISGTSMATPHVTGLAALMFAQNPDNDYAKIRETILDSVDKSQAYDGRMLSGGRINAYEALSANAPRSSGGGGCFIATAAWGREGHPMVVLFRRFRDEHLVDNAVGRAFIKLYYRLSPPLAGVIARSEVLRAASRTVLTPLAAGVALWMHPLGRALYMATFGAFLVSALVYRKRRSVNRAG